MIYNLNRYRLWIAWMLDLRQESSIWAPMDKPQDIGFSDLNQDL